MYKVMSEGGFLRLSNSENKVWILPSQYTKLALGIYEPSSAMGRIVKSVLPLISRVPFVARIVGAREVGVDLCVDLRKLISRVLAVDDFYFSIFEGTESVHKKPTIQIFSSSEILAYCKFSSDPDIVELFERERRMLDHLQSVGFEVAPSCLYCGEVDGQPHCVAYITSTAKTLESNYPQEWSAKHWEFMSNLHRTTRSVTSFGESDLARSLSELKGYLRGLPLDYGEVCRHFIGLVEEHYGERDVEFSAYHGDFTPWNMFVERGRLYAFDWEYSSLSYPPYLDWFHFFTQTALVVKHLSAQQIVEVFREESAQIEPYVRSVELSYMAYLLSIISTYVARERGVLTLDTQHKLNVWISILKQI